MADAQSWGVDLGFHDALGNWREPPGPTVDAILASMGAGEDRPKVPPVISLRLDRERPPLPAGQVLTEDGGSVDVDGASAPELPVGYHHLVPADGGEPVLVLVSPGRCYLPDGLRIWGWAAQLYAARSRQSWGVGDLADLRWLAQWSAGEGAGMALVNPLHAALPGPRQEPSPYFASSRCFANPIYLRVEEVPGAERLSRVEELAGAGRALNTDRRIDRDAVWRLKSEALEAIFAGFEGAADFDRYCAERGTTLEGFATFAALCERFGAPWQRWPEAYRRPDAPGVAEFAADADGAGRIRYHAWLQWLLDRQLAAAGQALHLVQDLAIGVNAGGADAWLWQDSFALGMRVGAPPDEFNTLGQDWGLPPWDPWRLQRAGFDPFIQTVRAGLRHSGGLRFDHVMGLFRLYWIPEGVPPSDGTYVRYPWQTLLDILAIESHRAGAFVVGEDLGTVEDFVRPELAERGVLSYRLLWFEPEWPDRWPWQALAAISTHDLPTVAGLWTGVDLEAQRTAGMSPNVEGTVAMRDKLAAWTGLDQQAPVEQAIERAYSVLAHAPSVVLTATLDDALAVRERPNMPGTVEQWPNWSIALPQPIEVLEHNDLARAIAGHLRR